jgi:hypothetical protein
MHRLINKLQHRLPSRSDNQTKKKQKKEEVVEEETIPIHRIRHNQQQQQWIEEPRQDTLQEEQQEEVPIYHHHHGNLDSDQLQQTMYPQKQKKHKLPPVPPVPQRVKQQQVPQKQEQYVNVPPQKQQQYQQPFSQMQQQPVHHQPVEQSQQQYPVQQQQQQIPQQQQTTEEDHSLQNQMEMSQDETVEPKQVPKPVTKSPKEIAVEKIAKIEKEINGVEEKVNTLMNDFLDQKKKTKNQESEEDIPIHFSHRKQLQNEEQESVMDSQKYIFECRKNAEFLTQKLLQLDSIDVLEDQELRSYRKQQIRHIQKLLNELDKEVAMYKKTENV